MTTQRTLLSIGTFAGVVLATSLAQTADLRPAVVTGLAGTLQIVQPAPCDNTITRTTPVTGGRLELTPAEGLPVAGGRRFTLTRANISFAPFSASGSCLGFSESRNYDTVHVQLGRAVTFTAASTSTAGVFAVSIPKEQFLVSYATFVDGDMESGTKFPKENVTGTINLATGAVAMHVVLGTRVTFRAGCVPHVGCAINETHDGTLTADLTGTIAFPDSDSDGVPDRADNCPFVANPTQSPVATPVITAPSNVTLASCLSRAFGTAKASDVCDGGPVTVTNNAPDPFSLGATTVTWTAQDAMSRTATDTQTVTIVDTTDPSFTFVPPNIAMNNCGPADLGLATAVDDCAGTVAITNNAPPYFYVGTTVVTWTAKDVSGNDATATQSVTVTDTVAPTVSCVATNPPGSSFRVSAFDACTSTPVIRLGSHVLSDGETVMINETGTPGVRLVNLVGAERLKHFLVGKGEAVITATDESGNVGSVTCR